MHAIIYVYLYLLYYLLKDIYYIIYLAYINVLFLHFATKYTKHCKFSYKLKNNFYKNILWIIIFLFFEFQN